MVCGCVFPCTLVFFSRSQFFGDFTCENVWNIPPPCNVELPNSAPFFSANWAFGMCTMHECHFSVWIVYHKKQKHHRHFLKCRESLNCSSWKTNKTSKPQKLLDNSTIPSWWDNDCCCVNPSQIWAALSKIWTHEFVLTRVNSSMSWKADRVAEGWWF